MNHNQRYEEEPVICEDRRCPLYRSFELRDVDEVKKDERGEYYYICDGCGGIVYP